MKKDNSTGTPNKSPDQLIQELTDAKHHLAAEKQRNLCLEFSLERALLKKNETPQNAKEIQHA